MVVRSGTNHSRYIELQIKFNFKQRREDAKN
jgi:hypothetical protein